MAEGLESLTILIFEFATDIFSNVLPTSCEVSVALPTVVLATLPKIPVFGSKNNVVWAGSSTLSYQVIKYIPTSSNAKSVGEPLFLIIFPEGLNVPFWGKGMGAPIAICVV